MLLERLVLQAQDAGGLVDPVLPGERRGFRPQLPGQSLTTSLPAAPLIKLASCKGKRSWDIHGWSGAHQRFSRKSVSPARPGSLFHGPPIRPGLPAAADDTPSAEPFHADPPKGHTQAGREWSGLPTSHLPFRTRPKANCGDTPLFQYSIIPPFSAQTNPILALAIWRISVGGTRSCDQSGARAAPEKQSQFGQGGGYQGSGFSGPPPVPEVWAACTNKPNSGHYADREIGGPGRVDVRNKPNFRQRERGGKCFAGEELW